MTDSSVPSPAPQISQPLSISSTEPETISKPNSPQQIDTSVNKVTSSGENANIEQTDEDIIREQQRKIEELQRQLLNSQLLLQQQRQQQQQLQQQARSSQTFQVEYVAEKLPPLGASAASGDSNSVFCLYSHRRR